MDFLFSYLLRSIIVAGVLTAYYWWVLRDRKFHRYNRFFLLAMLALSLIVPLMRFAFYKVDAPSNKAITGLLGCIGPNRPSDRYAWTFTWPSMLLAAAGSVSLFLLARLLGRVVWVYRQRCRYHSVRMNGLYFIETDLAMAPFSFFNTLFWRKDIPFDSENGQRIFQHEYAHIRGKHTYDKLTVQALSCIFWINPFYWIIQKELELVHEYIADSRSIGEGNGPSFARMLLQVYNKGRHLDPTHTFFSSSIKRRLAMITTSDKTSFSYGRRILVLPVFLLVSALFSFHLATAQDKERDEQKERAEKLAFANRSPEAKEAEANEQRARARRQAEVILKNLPSALYLVNGTEWSRESIRKLDLSRIKGVHSLYIGAGQKEDNEHAQSPWGKEALSKYGDRAKNGIVEFIAE